MDFEEEAQYPCEEILKLEIRCFPEVLVVEGVLRQLLARLEQVDIFRSDHDLQTFLEKGRQ